MQTRVEITEIKHSLWKYPELRENLVRLDDEVLKFCNIIGGNTEETLRLLQARRNFETCLTICKSLIDPQTNEYVEKVNTTLHSYDVFIDGIGNALAILDKLESEIESTGKQLEYNPENKAIPKKIAFKSYKFREKLKDYMENMIILPFLSAIKNFYNFPNDTEKGKIIKDKKLFMYLLFRELYGSVEIKGSEKRLLGVTGAGNIKMQETNIYKTGKGRQVQEQIYEDTPPPEIPENIHFDPFADTEVTEDAE